MISPQNRDTRMAIEPNSDRERQTHGTSRIDAVDEPAKKKGGWLPWLLALLGLLALLFLLSRCNRDEPSRTPVEPVETNTVVADVTGETAAAGTAAAGAADSGNILADMRNYFGSGEGAGRRFTFDGIKFATSSAAIPPEASPTITGLAQLLKENPNARIRVEGYADARGNDTANRKLGADRAAAVKQALSGAGVAANRIETATGGEQNPVDSNATQTGRTENRRTDVVVTAK